MPLGEADRLVTLFTPDKGKIRVVARGVRRSKSRMRGHLEQLSHVRLSVAHGRSLDVVSESETLDSFRKLRENLYLVSTAIFMTELIDAFSSEESASQLEFNLLMSVLHVLPEVGSTIQLITYFEAKLLGIAGFGPELRSCVQCGDSLEPRAHLFSPPEGGLYCPKCRVTSIGAMRSVTVNAIKVLRFYQMEGLNKSMGIRLSSDLLEEIERFLKSYLRFVLEKELKSLEFMNRVHDVGL